VSIPPRQDPSQSLVWALAALVALAAMSPDTARAADDLLANPRFEGAAGSTPGEWRIDAWVNSPDALSHGWVAARADSPGQVWLRNLKPNDSRFVQTLSLSPGWYRFTCEIQTAGVGHEKTGASISILDGAVMSPDLRGTTDWTTVGFHLKVGEQGATVNVALRLGGFGSLNTGQAHFRNLALVRVDSPPAGSTPVYDLAQIRAQAPPKPVGSRLALLLAFLALAAVAVWGWRNFLTAAQPIGRALRSRRRGASR
jgi:hypothetical protein